MNTNHSYIKKSTLIRDFRMQVNGKSKTAVQELDTPFFDTINRVFRKKPNNVVMHIATDNTLTFNITFESANLNVFLEYFPKTSPSTLLNITPINGDDILDPEMSLGYDELGVCLDKIDDSLLSTVPK